MVSPEGTTLGRPRPHEKRYGLSLLLAHVVVVSAVLRLCKISWSHNSEVASWLVSAWVGDHRTANTRMAPSVN